MKCNRGEIASILGISLPTVVAWHKDGMPAAQEGAKGKEWVFDTEDVLPWWALNKFHVKDARSAGPKAQHPTNPFATLDLDDMPETIDQAELRKEIALADLNEIKVAKEAGLLVPVDEVVATVLKEHMRAKMAVVEIPSKLRPHLMTYMNHDKPRVEKLIELATDTINDALSNITSYND